MTNLKTIAIGAAIAATVAGMSAGRTETVSIPVSYADLNLGAAAGVAVLNQRIAGAVTKICGHEISTDDSWPQVRKCRRDAFASARTQMTVALAQAATGGRAIELASR